MTPELLSLTLTALLAASLWIPYIVGVNLHPVAGQDNFLRPGALTDYPAWVHRAHRAHLNLVEQLLPFAVVVLVGQTLGISTTVTAFTSVAFLVIRIIHAVGMISGLARFPVRPAIFTAGWFAILVHAFEVIRLA